MTPDRKPFFAATYIPRTSRFGRPGMLELIPNHAALFRPTDGSSPAIDNVSEFVKSHVAIDGKATAYVCENHACSAPFTDVDELLVFLESLERRPQRG